MDWILYDNSLHHERVNISEAKFRDFPIILNKLINFYSP